MKALKELQSLGYQAEIKNGKLSLKYMGEGKPDKETVKPLLEELKQHKREAVTCLKGQPFESLFQKCLAELNKLLGEKEGLGPFLEDNFPGLLAEISETEAEIDNIWQKGIKGVATIEHFREVLKRYYKLNEKAINLFVN